MLFASLVALLDKTDWTVFILFAYILVLFHCIIMRIVPYVYSAYFTLHYMSTLGAHDIASIKILRIYLAEASSLLHSGSVLKNGTEFKASEMFRRNSIFEKGWSRRLIIASLWYYFTFYKWLRAWDTTQKGAELLTYVDLTFLEWLV